MKKYYIHILLFIYLLKVYVNLILNKIGFISDDTWCDLECIGNAVLLFSFTYLLKDKMNKFIYSLCISVFLSRLITELRNDGFEDWYEIINVLVFTTIFYFVLKRLKKSKK